MKKSNTMRVALLLLALTLITSCFVGGTFAKYVTGAKIQDTARVAKFGVDVSATNTDSLFKAQYATDDTSNTDVGTYSVEAVGNYDVVAPGTAGDVLGFSITGQPEVAVKVTFALEIEDVVLKAKANDATVNYPNMTMRDYVGAANGEYATFTLPEDYYPVKFTLTKVSTGAKLVENGTAAQVESALEGLSKSYDPNTNLANEFGEYKLSWAWAFGDPANNPADTLLGNLAVDDSLTDSANYDLNVKVDLQITVEQVD